jgi:hypothetical protein
MGDQPKSKVTDEEIARIVAAGEPGVESAMKVLEITEQRYFAAVSQMMPPPVTTRAVSHT